MPTKWWSGVVYQIYPRSFQDSNDDGVGDLIGIVQRLDYLLDLGVQTIWLSPTFTSPQLDCGYDISNYRMIDPLFGNMQDMECLIKEVHARGMRIILDGVFNHTSDQHRWFKESRKKGTEKAEWYIWRQKPNNWQSAFGGSAWEFCPQRNEYFLHTFGPNQPDLNWNNPDVCQEILSIQEFWYQKGVDGFRLDVFNAYCKDPEFNNNPRRLDLFSLLAGVPYGYLRYRHTFDRDRDELMPILAQFRDLANRYDAVLIGETLDERFSYEFAQRYTGDDALHFAFDFLPLHGSWRQLLKRIQTVSERQDMPTWVWSNHDFTRQSHRWKRGDSRSKLMLLIQMSLRGLPVIYYGEEIDIPQVQIDKEDIVDSLGKKFYPFFRGRDGARTPMLWTADAGAGFTTAKPWLPLGDYKQNVKQQLVDQNSVLNWSRKVIKLRNNIPALIDGSIEWIKDGFIRELDGEKYRVVINTSSRSMKIPTECVEHNLLLRTDSLNNSALSPVSGGIWKV